jgi:uncharacterized membrane protein YGL010W
MPVFSAEARGARTLEQWLDEYSASHQSAANKLLHLICVPLIVLALMGMLSVLPFPGHLAATVPGLNWASLTALAAVAYYLRLSRALALGAVLVFIALLGIVHGLAAVPLPLWLSSLVIFLLAWIGQFVGHALEGKRPSFFKDLQFLLIGPLWLLAWAYRCFGLRY